MNQLSSLPPDISSASTGAGTDASASPKPAAKIETDGSSSIADTHVAFDKHLPSPLRQHATDKIATTGQNLSTLPTVAKQEDKESSKDSSPHDSGSADPAATMVGNLVIPLVPVASPLVHDLSPTIEAAEKSESDHLTATDMPRDGSRLPARLSAVFSPAFMPSGVAPSPIKGKAKSAGESEPTVSPQQPIAEKTVDGLVRVSMALDAAPSPIKGKAKSAGESEPTVSPQQPIGEKTVDGSVRVPMALDAAPSPLKEKEKSADQSEPRIIPEEPVAKEIPDRAPGQSPFAPAAQVVGTNAAKQHIAMSKAEIESKPKSQVILGQPFSEVTSTPDQSHVSVPSAEDFSFTPRQGDADSHATPGDLAEHTVVATGKSTPPFAPPEPPPQMPRVKEVSHLFEEVSQAIERLRTDGRTNVELQIKLHDGAQLVVKVQMHGGELKTTFKTDSTEWREAIAQGWSSFSSDSANRGMRMTSPVFESPAAQSRLNDFDNQRQQRREQAETMSSDQAVKPRSWKKPSAPTPAPSPLREATLRGERITVWA